MLDGAQHGLFAAAEGVCRQQALPVERDSSKFCVQGHVAD
jgi:hypothetical protein